MTKIGVYTISLNEEQFAERWAKSAIDADYLFVADTGSTDKTVSILKKNKVNVIPIKVKPWRFDDARNTSLNLLPSDLDILISLDMDETLVKDWRKIIESEWKDNTTRMRYLYVWNWYYDKPGLTFHCDKIAGRFTHRWKHPVHEILKPVVPEVFCSTNEVVIEHHPDNTKSRGQYLPLLKMSVEEDPSDDRNSYYLGREYFLHNHYHEAIKELQRHLDLPKAKWEPERAASMRHIAKSYEALGDFEEASYWYSQATFEDPFSKEALIDAGQFALARNSFHLALHYSEKALSLPASHGSYLNERYASNEGAYDLASVANYHLGNIHKAIQFAEKAIELNEHDQRLQNNLKMMKS